MSFIDDNFLLKNKTARELFHSFAKETPIIDFHCHISPKDICEDVRFSDISQAWLGGDHYKWRAMRCAGVPEQCITGDASAFTKFEAYVKTLTQSPGNPLYHWSHLELQRYFDIHDPLTEDNARDIYDRANAKLAKDGYSVRALIKRSNVKVIFTTDDPVDTLEYHQKLKDDNSFDVTVLPAFRPDRLFGVDTAGFCEYISELAKASGAQITDMDSLFAAVKSRIEFFESMGCRASDHALYSAPFATSSKSDQDAILKKALSGKEVSAEEKEKYVTALLQFLAGEYSKRGWAMELHIGTIRNNSSRMMKALGPDCGFDSVADTENAAKLAKLLDSMDVTGNLPKTLLFAGNQNDNVAFATLCGCFQGETKSGATKVQLGTAWWFNDHIDGMAKQIKDYANLGALGKFIGMLTDSRSFLSYPRHEYFRRILCNIIGEWIENGEYYATDAQAEQLVKGICFNNAMAFFELEV